MAETSPGRGGCCSSGRFGSIAERPKRPPRSSTAITTAVLPPTSATTRHARQNYGGDEEIYRPFHRRCPKRRRCALAMIAAIDDGVRQNHVDRLKTHGLLENALVVIFTSDNGAPLQAHTRPDGPVDANLGGWDSSINDQWKAKAAYSARRHPCSVLFSWKPAGRHHLSEKPVARSTTRPPRSRSRRTASVSGARRRRPPPPPQGLERRRAPPIAVLALREPGRHHAPLDGVPQRRRRGGEFLFDETDGGKRRVGRRRTTGRR
ncbi:MAG: sulfatase-like hydrolase/transferase [Akkermansiaceae bacterium]|nr:sulfatase-like hydrolase/transferase [Akkermansiaceae bacterium]